MLAPKGRKINSIYGNRIVAIIDKEGLAYIGMLIIATVSTTLIALFYKCFATKNSRGRVVKVKSEPKYVIDLVANDILGNEDCAAPVLSDFGIALTPHSRDRYHINISRDGVVYRGGIVG